MQGLADVYGDWITQLQGRRVPGRHREARQRRVLPALGAEDPRGGARGGRRRLRDLRRGDRSTTRRALAYVRDRGLPNVLDFPFQDARVRLRRAAPPSARGSRTGSTTTTTSARPTGDADAGDLPRQPRHGPRRAQSSQHRTPAGGALLRQVLLGYDLLYLLRGAPTVYYGDEVGMIGRGGDKEARAGHVPDPGRRVEDGAAGRLAADRRRLVVRRDGNPIEAAAAGARALRDAHPALSTGATIVRLASDGVLVVSAGSTAAERRVRRGVQLRQTAAQVTVRRRRRRPRGRRFRGRLGRDERARRLALVIRACSAVLAPRRRRDPGLAPAGPS